MASLLGTGTSVLFFRRTLEPGVYEATYCIVLLTFPIFPLAQYRVRVHGMDQDSAGGIIYHLDWLTRYPSTPQLLRKLYTRQLIWLLIWLIPVCTATAFLAQYDPERNVAKERITDWLTSWVLMMAGSVGALWGLGMTFFLYSDRDRVFRNP